MTAAAIASRTETGVLVANHLAKARHFPKEVCAITGGGTQSPTITILPGEATSCLLIRQQVISVYSRCSPVGFLWRKWIMDYNPYMD
ncbi:hypothetical protein AVEN_159240-1 [Araneus ventricosus]|uniref:Uncharacterized protein n=1 Tax=Araneus ventricosus TaxID=182803 RepID=A0A4Y2A079_ARAVE|nr:hypothetical protein AVEN_159240-1 [Araneus ventricosus]